MLTEDQDPAIHAERYLAGEDAEVKAFQEASQLELENLAARNSRPPIPYTHAQALPEKDVLEWMAAGVGKPFRGWEAEWDALTLAIGGVLLKVRGLPVDYSEAVCKIVQRETWRRKKKPLAYVYKSAIGLALEMGLVGQGQGRAKRRYLEKRGLGPDELPEDYQGEDSIADLFLVYRNGQALLHDEQVEHVLHEAWDGFLGDRETLMDRLRPELLTPDGRRVNWGAVASLLGLSLYELQVCDLRDKGLSRAQILSGAGSEEERLGLQAAWRGLPGVFSKNRGKVIFD